VSLFLPPIASRPPDAIGRVLPIATRPPDATGRVLPIATRPPDATGRVLPIVSRPPDATGRVLPIASQPPDATGRAEVGANFVSVSLRVRPWLLYFKGGLWDRQRKTLAHRFPQDKRNRKKGRERPVLSTGIFRRI